MAKVNNGSGDINSILLPPVPVTKDKIGDTVVKDGFWTLEQLLTSPELKAKAAELGLQ